MRMECFTCWQADIHLSIPNMSAIYWPSFMADQRLMSCLLGTHILYACVPHVSKQCHWVFSLSTKAESILPECSGDIVPLLSQCNSLLVPGLEENVVIL